VSYFYDHLGRLCGRKDTAENSTQYFYAYPEKPYLVSHVYSSRAGVNVIKTFFKFVTEKGQY
jgi:hypothetical protein